MLLHNQRIKLTPNYGAAYARRYATYSAGVS